jgi:hypothetical protein
MDFGRWIREAVEILQLDEDAIRRSAASDEATLPAFVFVLIASAAGAIGGLVGFGGFNPMSLATIIVGPIFFFVFVAIFWAFARLFGGTASFAEHFRPVGLSQLASWIGVVPCIGAFIAMLAGLWLIAVNVVVVRTVHGISTGAAIAVILIPFVLCCCLVGGIAVAMGGLAALAGLSVGAGG